MNMIRHTNDVYMYSMVMYTCIHVHQTFGNKSFWSSLECETIFQIIMIYPTCSSRCATVDLNKKFRAQMYRTSEFYIIHFPKLSNTFDPTRHNSRITRGILFKTCSDFKVTAWIPRVSPGGKSVVLIWEPTRHNPGITRGFLVKTRGDLAEFTWFVQVGGGLFHANAWIICRRC